LFKEKQLPNFYIYNKIPMAWIVKKEYKGKTVPNCNYPLDELTQNQIKKLGESIRNSYFIEEKPKKKKKIDTVN
jgi:hypothetical protein|tara:strand:+ start:691 stop:912 length:222 start_codon:yes stop_codon:yes gene_type:complete